MNDTARHWASWGGVRMVPAHKDASKHMCKSGCIGVLALVHMCLLASTGLLLAHVRPACEPLTAAGAIS